MPAAAHLPNNQRVNYWLVLSLLVAAVAVMPWDVVWAQFFLSDPLPGELRGIVHKTEFFGHAYGILGIAFTIHLVCDDRRRQLPRLLSAAFFAGIVCDGVKLIIHRVRPVDFSFADGERTFLGLSWRHVDSWPEVFNSQYHSFPSAHTATSVAFAMVLGAMFPRAAKWFLTLSFMVAASRFDGGAHYVSDTLVGGAIGYVVGTWMLSDTLCGRLFSEFEAGRRRTVWPTAISPAVLQHHAQPGETSSRRAA